jgi:hypothetical protein
LYKKAISKGAHKKAIKAESKPKNMAVVRVDKVSELRGI